MKLKLKFIEREGRRFYYVDFGSEAHGRRSFRLWISSALIIADALKNKEFKFPVAGLIHKTQKGNYVLRPSSEHVTIDVYVPCGYRGESDFTFEDEPVMALWYEVYRSALGSLGVSKGCLASFRRTQFPIYYTWSTSGRTYGAPKEGRMMVTADGRVSEALPPDEELETI